MVSYSLPQIMELSEGDRTKRPILVTGTHRSGSTWVGQMLSKARETGYIHEPFNLAIRMGTARDVFDCWFQYVGIENEDVFRDVIAAVLAFQYPLRNNLRKVTTIHEGLKLLKDQSLFWQYQLRGVRPVIKDPIAFFAAEWMAQYFDLSVVVLIRHPAAFYSSLKLMNWQFDFEHLWRQPLLMERYLSPFADDIRDHAVKKKSLLSQAVLFWNCIHRTILLYQKQHPDWQFVRHEDLSYAPTDGFRKLYSTLNLRYTPAVEQYINRRSGAQNSAEHHSNHEFVRHSKANIDNWKRRLTFDEIDYIRKETAPLSDCFYNSSDW